MGIIVLTKFRLSEILCIPASFSYLTSVHLLLSHSFPSTLTSFLFFKSAKLFAVWGVFALAVPCARIVLQSWLLPAQSSVPMTPPLEADPIQIPLHHVLLFTFFPAPIICLYLFLFSSLPPLSDC